MDAVNVKAYFYALVFTTFFRRDQKGGASVRGRSCEVALFEGGRRGQRNGQEERSLQLSAGTSRKQARCVLGERFFKY